LHNRKKKKGGEFNLHLPLEASDANERDKYESREERERVLTD
jgi:hypothetical protein